MRNILLVILLLFWSVCLWGQTHELQLNPIRDTYVTNSSTSSNYGSSTKMYLGPLHPSKSQYWIHRIYIQFDMSLIPEEATIVSASLILAVNSGTPSLTNIEKVIEGWGESFLNWNNQPGTDISTAFAVTPTVSSVVNNYHTFSGAGLTDIVKSWFHTPETNFGLQLRNYLESSGNYNSYYSNNYTISLAKPRLHIVYTLPIEIDLVSVTHASGISSGDGSITASASEGDGTYTYQWYNSSGSAIGTNSPTISGLDYGWYGVKVTDGVGNESYMSFIVGVECEKVSITYNPGADYVDDAYISNYRSSSQDYRGLNFGGDVYNRVQRVYYSGDYAGYYNWKGLLKFRVQIDNSFRISSANLLLSVVSNSGTTNNTVFRTVTDNWYESFVTYNNQPGHSSVVEKGTGITSTGQKIIDTKDFWEYWKSNDNNGFFIDLENPSLNMNRITLFRSSDVTSTAIKPIITFEVSLDCGSPVKAFRELSSSYYSSKRGKLFVEYEELNNKEVLEYRILNSQHENISTNQALVSTVRPHGKSILEFNFGSEGQCLPTGFYILELVDENGRVKVLRFKHESIGC